MSARSKTLKQAGKIRSFGASNFKPGRFAEGIAEAKKRGVRFDAQQPEYNLMNREIEAELVPLCEREGVSLLPYYGLGQRLSHRQVPQRRRQSEERARRAHG